MDEPQTQTKPPLNLPTRRVIACLGILAFLTLYIWGVSALSGFLPKHILAPVIYYGLAGLLWGIPVLPLISWSENYKAKKKK
jgi:hypothetical protein